MSFFLGNRKRLSSFTDSLFELVSGGISLQKSLEILKKSFEKDKKSRENISFLLASLFDGVKFSLALRMATIVRFPDWYCSFIAVSEECGNLSKVLCYLSEFLKKEKKTREKLASSLAYPLVVLVLTALAGLFSVFYFLPSFSLIFENAQDIKSEAIKTMILADVFIVFAFFLIFSVVKKILSENPCMAVLRTMAFLCSEHVPTLCAISCTFGFAARNKKIAFALLSVRNSLLGGEKLSACFGTCFEKAGFKKEGILLSENLLLDESTGKNSAFEKTVEVLQEWKNKKEKLLLSSLQPILLCVSALYISLILKTAFLPYLTNFGGFV